MNNNPSKELEKQIAKAEKNGWLLCGKCFARHNCIESGLYGMGNPCDIKTRKHFGISPAMLRKWDAKVAKIASRIFKPTNKGYFKEFKECKPSEPSSTSFGFDIYRFSYRFDKYLSYDIKIKIYKYGIIKLVEITAF